MQFDIRGDLNQLLDVRLAQEESIVTERYAAAWMGPHISVKRKPLGGILEGIAGMLGGNAFALSTYTCTRDVDLVTITGVGRITQMALGQGQRLLCARDAFLAADENVTVDTHFQKKMKKQALVIHRLDGPGTLFLTTGGELSAYTLGEGDIIKADPDAIAFLDPGVTFSIDKAGGFRNSEQSEAIVTLKGPGRVWLQSLSFSALAREILPYIPKK